MAGGNSKEKKEKKKKKKKRKSECLSEKKKKKKKRSEVDSKGSSLDADKSESSDLLNSKTSQVTECEAPSCGWGSVFAAAASVKPIELDNDFLQRTEIPQEAQESPSGISKVAQLAAEAMQNSEGNIKDNVENAVESEARFDSSPSNNEKEKKKKTKKRKREEKKMSKQEEKASCNPPKTKKKKKVASEEKETEANEKQVESSPADLALPSFPFPVEPDDHCESPLEAYQDIVPFLQKIAASQSKDISIYDPYYCNGGVIRNLKDLGFPNVYNKKEDCYRVWSSSETRPTFDVLVTNPPYSGEHIPKLIQFLTTLGDRPWFLLLPQWVHKKDYFVRASFGPAGNTSGTPFYLVPSGTRRYVYVPPKDFREKKISAVHKKSSPFVSMWFVWGGTRQRTEMLIRHFQAKKNEIRCELARTKSALRDLRRKGKQRG